jgi:hypothetical protein
MAYLKVGSDKVLHTVSPTGKATNAVVKFCAGLS